MSKIAFVFSGQGAQYVGMCKELYEEEQIVKDTLDSASDILNINVAKMCFDSNAEELGKTVNAQIAVFVVSVAQFRLFMQKKSVVPDFLAGNSVGEYAALVCGGALKFEDALMLLHKRAQLMNEVSEETSGTMYAVKNLETQKVKEVLEELKNDDDVLCISNYNGKNNVVISGMTECVEKAAVKLQSMGAQVIKLKVSSGFHSPLMKKAAQQLKLEVEKYEFFEPTTCILANVTGLPYKNAIQIKELLPIQVTSPVLWYPAMQYMEHNGCDTAIEFGARAVLSNLFKENTSISSYSFDKKEDRKVLEQIFYGKSDFIDAIAGFLTAAVCSKNYNSDISGYDSEVVIPYRKIETIYNGLTSGSADMSNEIIDICRKQLEMILCYKRIPEGIQKNILNGLIMDAENVISNIENGNRNEVRI